MPFNKHFNTLLLYTLLSLFLSPLSFPLGWNTFGHKTPIWPTGHVAMLNQRPGDGHMAAKSIEAKLEEKLPAVQPNCNITVHTV